MDEYPVSKELEKLINNNEYYKWIKKEIEIQLKKRKNKFNLRYYLKYALKYV